MEQENYKHLYYRGTKKVWEVVKVLKKISTLLIIIVAIVLLVSVALYLNKQFNEPTETYYPVGKDIIPIQTPAPRQYLEIISRDKFMFSLSDSGLTTIQKISKYNSYVGKYVRWYMPVSDVKNDYVILTSSAPKSVYIYGVDESTLMSLKKGQYVLP